MAYLYRIAAFLLLLLFSLSAFSATCVKYSMLSPGDGKTTSPDFDTDREVCQWGLAEANKYLSGSSGSFSYTDVTVYPANSTCDYRRSDGASIFNYILIKDCPSTCLPLGSNISGTSEDQQYSGGTAYTGGLLCYGGCSVYPSFSAQSVDGKWFAKGPLTSAGEKATCTDTSGGGNAGEAPALCPVGKCPGTVNGVEVCVLCSVGTTDTKTTETTKPPTTETTTPPSDGSTTTDRGVKTTCDGASCTTTTTTSVTDPTGVKTTTVKTETTPKDSFCTENPKSPLCVEGSFSGSCGGAFACKGDALMCAMAEEQHKRNCELFVNPSDESALYDTAKGLDSTKSVVTPTDVNVSSSSFDTSNALGVSASCNLDKTVVIYGKSLVLPFSKICPYLEHLGSVLMLVSFLIAIRIVSRG